MPGEVKKKYWMSLPQVDGDVARDRAAEPDASRSILAALAEPSRRGFLKAAGFSFAGSIFAGCTRAPVEKAIPYLVQPEEVVPGRAYHYSSTCGACSAGCGLIVKNRDGRPIKLEGNPDHPISRGGLCAAGQASILGLYDNQRLRHALHKGKKASWPQVDAEITQQLAAIKSQGGAVRVLTGTLASPTAAAVLDAFLEPFADARRVTYEALSCSAIRDAHERTHGARLLPRYRFDKADVIASFDADFLGTWISPVEFTAGYRQGRRLGGESQRFLHHVQFESRFSITGGKADHRHRVDPGELGAIVTHLAAKVAKLAGATFDAGAAGDVSVDEHALSELAHRLWKAKGRGLVVCGSQDVGVQVLCNFINHLLGNYGQTVDLAQPSQQCQGNDAELQQLIRELLDGKVKALFLLGVNPVFDLPGHKELAAAIERVPLVVSLATKLDETSRLAGFVCPDHHALESWGDLQSVHGSVSFFQPTVSPLGETRSMLESFATWSGKPRTAYDILRERWPNDAVWERAVHDGYLVSPAAAAPVKAMQVAAVRPVRRAKAPADGAFSLVLYAKVGMLDGRHAANPWLHELPDPISKATWDNYACLSHAAAERLGVKEGDVIRIETAAKGGKAQSIDLPVLLQPGQHDGVVAIALGYGSEESRRFAEVGPQWLESTLSVGDSGLVGVNAAGLLAFEDGTLRYAGRPVKLSATGRNQALALTQEHHTITVPEHLAPAESRRRPMIQENVLSKADEPVVIPQHFPPHDELWPRDHEFKGHHWGMVIDLTTCTGCAACVVACQVENNIPVVGKDEVRRNREMHWIRIDRYYSGERGDVDVAHQPMMCHHCDHAPCETVCPVLATVHSAEGLNQQTYNRCVGTRYCANNCPYKVRRFNWFDYPHDDRLANMTLNPDVTIRSRGVMEKCSFCVQRIGEAKIEAKRRGVALVDGDVKPACQQSCPAGAIVFGDMNDPESRVSQLIANGRHYRVLDEINVRPSVGYLNVIRDREATQGSEQHG